MRLINMLRPVKAMQDHYARLRERDPAEQEAEINKELTPFKKPASRTTLEAPRYSLPLERIAQLGLDHDYRFIETTYPGKDIPQHVFELLDERIVKNDEKARSLSERKQTSFVYVLMEGRSYLPTLLVDTNRYTISTEDMDKVARRRGYRYSHTTEPDRGCSWHVFERLPERQR